MQYKFLIVKVSKKFITTTILVKWLIKDMLEDISEVLYLM